jgi:rhamnose transport system permease protein
MGKVVKKVLVLLVALAGCGGGDGRPTVAMMPKNKGNPYFISCRKGAEEAAAALGVNLVWDGPTETKPERQAEIVESWIARGVDAIAVSVENREGLATSLRKARAKGIKVVTWDADTAADARDFFCNQATSEGIGVALMDHAARLLGGPGEFAIITASLTAGNQNEWIRHLQARRDGKHPQAKLAVIRPCDDVPEKALAEAKNILNAHPAVRVIVAICSPAVPQAAEAVKQSGRKDVKVIGLGLPSENRRYVHEGFTDGVLLWKTVDLGYLAVQAAGAAVRGTLRAGASSFSAGRLGTLEVVDGQVILGTPFTFTRENIDQFDF